MQEKLRSEEDSFMATVQHQQATGWVGWIGFASFMMALVGIAHIIYGIGALASGSWYLYSSGTAYLLSSTDAWGWSMIAGGALLLMTSYLVLQGNMFGRVIGSLLVLGSLVANVSLLPLAPVWSIIAIFLDVMVLYAIMAHGSEMKHLDETEA
jgi:hypothetical protein